MNASIARRDPKVRRRDGKRTSESVIAIREESSFWRASATPEHCDRENFFIAKPRDSESAHTAFSRHD